jgi:tripartite-type tricarboxylate transporter receptor subunit TctC
VPSPSTPEEFTAFVQAEQVKWGPVVTAVGIKLD